MVTAIKALSKSCSLRCAWYAYVKNFRPGAYATSSSFGTRDLGTGTRDLESFASETAYRISTPLRVDCE
mgnify:CR=1 FL=1